jgi:hypothetical protein
MTYPENRTPNVPGQPTPNESPQPNQYWPPQPPYNYGPTPWPSAPAGPPVKPPTKPPTGPGAWKHRGFWLRGPGVIVTTIVVGLLVVGLLMLGGQSPRSNRSPAAPFTVTVTNCDATNGALATATVSFTITNTSTTARSARVDVEYRDNNGNRLDTDTAYVRDIAPGDTVRHDESTILDADPGYAPMSCAIIGVR